MSDSFITLVPLEIDNQKPEELAVKLIAYLQQKKIIQSELSNKIFSTPGYKPDTNFKETLKSYDLYLTSINGLEVRLGRQVFDNGGNGLEHVNCPHCNFNIISTNWTDAVQEWYDGKNGIIKCELCQQNTSIIEYDFQPKWGFGELGFTFWNCPQFKEEFIVDIENLLESKIEIVFGRL